MANLPSAISQFDDGNTLRFSFYLERNPTFKESREAWDMLFKNKDDYVMPIEVGLAVGNELPLVVQSAQPFCCGRPVTNIGRGSIFPFPASG